MTARRPSHEPASVGPEPPVGAAPTGGQRWTGWNRWTLAAHPRAVRLLLLGVVLALLSGCGRLAVSHQPTVAAGRDLLGHSLGQTLVPRYDGLAGVAVYLHPDASCPDGSLGLTLGEAPDAPPLATATLDGGSLAGPGFYRFAFPPLSRSSDRFLYFALTAEGQCPPLQVGVAPGATYLDGSAYEDGRPLPDGQLAFRLEYDRPALLLGLLRQGLQWPLLLAAGAFLFLLPGYGALAFLDRSGEAWRGYRGFALATALSLALYPVLVLWTGLLGLRLGWLYAVAPGVLGATAIVARWRPWRRRLPWSPRRLLASLGPPEAALTVAVTLLIVSRLLPVRSLPAPLWGDSYQHTLITQLLIDNGGLFDSWRPYVDLATFSYHFGFHSLAAVFHWLTGLSSPEAVLVVGQLLNVLAVLGAACLAAAVGRSRWAAPAAVVVAGLLSPMPSLYANWGRYTQLAGQAILPGAMLATWLLLRRPRPWLMAVAAIVVAGLGITHYRVLILYVLFVPAAWVAALRLPSRDWVRAALRPALAAVPAAILFLPQFLRARHGTIVSSFAVQLSRPAGSEPAFAYEYNAIGDVTFYLSGLLWVCLLAGIGVGLWRRERLAAALAAWWLAALLATNPALLRLPGTGAIGNFTLFIAAYIPAAAFIGLLAGRVLEALARGPALRYTAAGVLVALALLGTAQRFDDIDPQAHALVTRPDLRAMRWVEANTPGDARFLVNSFFAFGGNAMVGSDGGWWLPLLAGRGSTVPPLNYDSERGHQPDYRARIESLAALIWEKGATSDEAVTALRREGVGYVYIGQRQGAVNGPPRPYLMPEELIADGRYRVVYHEDRVWVFELAR